MATTCSIATAQDNPASQFDSVFAAHKGKLGYDRFKSEFLNAIEKHKSAKRDNAVAVARDIGGRWAYGTSHGLRNKQEAKQQAIQYCKKYRKQFSIEAPCKVYLVNSKVVLEAY